MIAMGNTCKQKKPVKFLVGNSRRKPKLIDEKPLNPCKIDRKKLKVDWKKPLKTLWDWQKKNKQS